MPNVRKTPVLVLDCDGVLVRSEGANLAYYNHLFERFGLPRVGPGDRDALGLLHTLSTPQVIDRFVPEALRDRVRAYADELAFDRFLPLLQAEPGWDEVLRRRAGFDRAVVATNRGGSARTVLEAVGLLGLVDDVVTVRDVARPKPHPDLLLAAAARAGASPAEAVYVGDSGLDARAARAAGLRFIGFRRSVPPSVDAPDQVDRLLARLAADPALGKLARGRNDNRFPTKEVPMSQKDMFHTPDNTLKRGCQVSDADVDLCPCGSKQSFAKCHGAPCECGSGKPKFKCCHSDDF